MMSQQCRNGLRAAAWGAATLGGLSTSAYAQTAAPAALQVPTFRGSEGRAGYSPQVLTFPLSVSWKRTVSSSQDNPSSPVVSGDTVYTASGHTVQAVSASTGSVSWTFTSPGTVDGNIVTSPTLSGTGLYVGTDDGTVYKLSTDNGTKVWQTKIGGSIHSSPVVDSGSVMLGCDDSNAYGLATDTGAITWKTATGGAIAAPPTVEGDIAVFASSDNSLYGINVGTGRIMWTQRLSGDPSVSFPVVDEGTLYVGAGSYVYAMNPRTGGARWRTRLPSEVTTPLSIGASGMYVVTQDNNLCSLNSRGKVVWSAKLDYPSQGNLLVTPKAVVVPTQHGILYAFSADTGKLLWDYVVQPSTQSTAAPPKYTDIASFPVAAGGRLFVLSDDGALTAFEPNGLDSASPRVSDMYPEPGALAAGLRVPFRATIIDDGTGINPSTLTLTVDNVRVHKAKYDPSANGLIIDMNDPLDDQPSPTLGDGPHQATLTVSDWLGNTTTRTWGFTVDIRLNPKDDQGRTIGDVPTLVPDTTAPIATPSNGQPGAALHQPAPQAPPRGPDVGGAMPPPPPPI